eukprot:symbB.v1.2.003737.t1/scaffold191.1/size276526/2
MEIYGIHKLAFKGVLPTLFAVSHTASSRIRGEVRLASRLLFLPHSFLVNELRKVKHRSAFRGPSKQKSTVFRREVSEEDQATEDAVAANMEHSIVGDGRKFDSSFSIHQWFPQPSRLQQHGTTMASTMDPSGPRGDRPERQRRSTMTSSGRGDNMMTVPEFFPKFLTLQAVAVDEHGMEQMTLEILLGMPVCCYPMGTRICLEVGQRR